jgi:hypothetical protein
MSETYPITSFTKGNITAPDKQDIPDDAAVYLANADGDTEEGKLRGINKRSLISSTIGQDISHGAWLLNTDGKYYFVYSNLSGNAIKVANDFYGTKTVSSLVSSNVSANTAFTAYNREVHAGTGYGSANASKWIGFIDYGQLGGAAPSGLQTIDANPAIYAQNIIGDIIPPGIAGKFGFGQPVTITSAGEEETGNFAAGTVVYYKFSLVYDNSQESVLCPEGLRVEFESNTLSAQIGVSAWDTYTNGVGYNTSAFNKRISAVKLYKAISADGTDAELSLFRLVKVFDFTTTDDFQGEDSEGAIYKGNASVAFYTDTNSYSEEGAGATYEAETGLPQTLETCTVNYALSTSLDGYHFVGNCYHTELPDARHRIFRSKKLRYDMFDWTSDTIVLPEIPTALVGYEGRLYAFSTNNAYRIDPENLIVENKFEGAGAISSKAVSITPFGLFFANKNDAYRIYNNEIVAVSSQIATSSSPTLTRGYRFDMNNVQDIAVAYCSQKKYVLFSMLKTVATLSGYVAYSWAYHVTKNRWDRWDYEGEFTAPAGAIGQFTGKDGEIYIADATGLYKLFADTTGTYQVTWISKEWNFGTPGQKKFLNKIKLNGVGAPSLYCGLNGADPSVSVTSEANINLYGNSFQMKVVLPTNAELDNLEIIYRRLIGNR